MQRFARSILQLGAPLAVLAFWGGMAAAAHTYPTGYDWRYQTISVLTYPDHDPRGYFWAWMGLELCGLAGIAWSSELIDRFKAVIGTPHFAGLQMMRVGFLSMCCAVLPDRLLPLPKGHELLAIVAFVGISAGVAQQIFMVIANSGAAARRGAMARFWATACASVPLLPLLLAALTQAYLGLARPSLPWVSPAWRSLGIPIYLSFGVWEWVSCAVFSGCFLVLWHRCAALASTVDARAAPR